MDRTKNDRKMEKDFDTNSKLLKDRQTWTGDIMEVLQ